MTSDPIRKLQRWWRDAARGGCPIPEAMALATADAEGRPSVRFVLLKGIQANGLTFYTNEQSRKGRELAANPRAALAFYWHEIDRQARVEGRVGLLSASEADAYWRTRPRGSQLASSVSEQSEPLASRADLVARLRTLERAMVEREVPRPTHWRGYLLEPDVIEFWTRREPRLHIRELHERRRGRWQAQLLQP